LNFKRISFSSGSTDFYFAGGWSRLKELASPDSTVLITDEHVYAAHTRRFRGWNTIVLKPGEEYKLQATADAIVEQLIGMEADRKTTLVGVGGGVVTDITGYVASVYMRGIRFGFVPTTMLGLVDASVGGKNGVDVGEYKNLVGIIRQPSFILHEMAFLRSLPEAQWQNGFAEIIKHAAIRDAAMFRELEGSTLKSYRSKPAATCRLVQRNVMLKAKVVQADEFEKNERRLLNFGHTIGHALETQYELLHGQAIAIGMTCAAHFSRQLAGFREPERLVHLLERYGLPTYAAFDKTKVYTILRMDKKRERSAMNFILLKRLGAAVVQPVSMDQLKQLLEEY